jgi:hypothetical protein
MIPQVLIFSLGLSLDFERCMSSLRCESISSEFVFPKVKYCESDEPEHTINI